MTFNFIVFEEGQKCGPTPLVAHSVLVCVFVFGLIAVVFVDGLVGEVDLHVVCAAFGGVFLSLTRIPHQPFVLQLHFKRAPRRHDHVEADVEFVVVNEQWIVNVVRHNLLVFVSQICKLVGQEDAFALGPVRGLHDLPFVLFLVHFRDQQATVVGNDLRHRQEVEDVFPEPPLFLQHVRPEAIFPRQFL